MKKRVANLEKSIISLAKDIKEIKIGLSKGFTVIDDNFKKIALSFKNVNADLEIITAKINKLQGNTKNSLKKVDGKLDNLTSEIKNINKVSGSMNS